MKKIICLVFLSIFSESSFAELMTNTVIFVRHAEKLNDGSRNPGLSPAGQKRAIKLKEILSKQVVGKIISTDTHRTRQTASPLALAKGLEVTVVDSQSETLNILKNLSYKETVLVVGHSNTLPAMIKNLGGPEIAIGENDFDYFVVLTILSESELTTTILSY